MIYLFHSQGETLMTKEMSKSLIQLTLIHFREFFREPGILFWALFFPILMAWVLGIAFSSKPETIQTYAVVRDMNARYEPLTNFLAEASTKINSYGKLEKTRKLEDEKLGRTSFRFIYTSWDTAILMLKRGQTQMIVRELNEKLEYNFDPRSSEAKLGYITLSSLLKDGHLHSVSAEIKPLTRVGTRYIDFLLPGLIGLGMMNSLFWGMCYGLIEMRMKKLLRRMVAAPMKKSEFLLSHFIARLSLSFVEAIILLLFAWLYFKIQIQGSILALLLLFFAGDFAFAGISVLIAARISTTRVASAVVNALALPMMVLSGIFFSYHNFPDFVIPIIKFLPLTMLADGMRSIFIEAAGITDVITSVVLLSLLGLLTFTIGLKLYRWY
jgi:ABC-2 type transport system permease protein